MASLSFYHFFPPQGFHNWATEEVATKLEVTILKQKAPKGRKQRVRGSERRGERERGHGGTRQRKLSQRDKTGWQRKREEVRGRGKCEEDREEERTQEQQLAHSWWLLNHCVSPLWWEVRGAATPSSCPALLSFSALGSSKLLCNRAGRGMKAGERSMVREMRFIIYLLWGAVKGLHWCFCTFCLLYYELLLFFCQFS